MTNRILIGLVMIVALLGAVGWYLFEQAGTSLNLYADRNPEVTVIP